MGIPFVITHTIKRLINKRRPNGGNYSFPSGYTSAAFAGAAFIERRYGLKVETPAYLLVPYVGWTSIESSYHYKWDILEVLLLKLEAPTFSQNPLKIPIYRWDA